jgi:Flp pilus assembly protein TadG
MNNQRGQGSVELVLLAPLMAVFLFLIWQFGWVFGAWLAMTNAAREGARKAITLNCDTFDTGTFRDSIRDRAQQTAQPWVPNLNDITVRRRISTSPTDPDCPATPTGSEVVACVIVVHRVSAIPQLVAPNIPFFGPMNGIPAEFAVVGKSAMRCE